MQLLVISDETKVGKFYEKYQNCIFMFEVDQIRVV